jgi:hypothetical protein
MLNHRQTFPVGKGINHGPHRIPFKISGVIFVDRKDPESRQNTSKK